MEKDIQRLEKSIGIIEEALQRHRKEAELLGRKVAALEEAKRLLESGRAVISSPLPLYGLLYKALDRASFGEGASHELRSLRDAAAMRTGEALAPKGGEE